MGEVKVAELVRRAEAGESALSLTLELGVANSAPTRMLRTQGVTIRKQQVRDASARRLAKEYEAGATMCELEAKHGLSHCAILRSLQKSGVEMRARGSTNSLRTILSLLVLQFTQEGSIRVPDRQLHKRPGKKTKISLRPRNSGDANTTRSRSLRRSGRRLSSCNTLQADLLAKK